MGKNNFLERLPNPTRRISDISSANVLIRGETSLFHRAIFHALTNRSWRVESGERPVEGAGWGLLWRTGKEIEGDNVKENTGESTVEMEDRIPPTPTQVKNITTSLILGGWCGWWSGPGLGLAASVTSGQGGV